MCLIAHVPSKSRMPDDYVESAYCRNPDGIGIMSSLGIEKFVGRKALKRAKRYLQTVHEAEVSHAIHFRYATHGAITLRNCHPFELPNGNGYLMHNGVLSDYTAKSTALDSDTALFALEHTSPEASDENNLDYWSAVAGRIGFNKLCVMLPNFRFVIVNSRMGTERNGIWYSQTYSLPHVQTYYGTPYSGYTPTQTQTVTGSENEAWGKWIRSRDPTTGRWFYRLPYEHEKQAPLPLLPRPAETNIMQQRLKESLERLDKQESADPWQAWHRDRHGNDPVADADKVLDTELQKHLANNCVACFKADVPTDDDGICDECLLKEDTEMDKGALLPGWSEHTPKHDAQDYVGRCVDCETPIDDDKEFCGEATGHKYCIGIGYELAFGSIV
jgi:hypothetical protein